MRVSCGLFKYKIKYRGLSTKIQAGLYTFPIYIAIILPEMNILTHHDKGFAFENYSKFLGKLPFFKARKRKRKTMTAMFSDSSTIL